MKTKIFKLMTMLLCAAMVCGLTSCNREEDGGDSSSDEWVDLGLPSGLLWAKHNVGAEPESYSLYIGGLYPWGCTGWYEYFYWEWYCHCRYTSSNRAVYLTKYNTREDRGSVDNLTILEPSDDRATSCGGRTPTYDDWLELINNTDGGIWTEQDGRNGWKFTAANGQSLFLPTTGYGLTQPTSWKIDRTETHLGFYWSSSLCTDEPKTAHIFSFSSDSCRLGTAYRCNGYAIRAVKSPSNK